METILKIIQLLEHYPKPIAYLIYFTFTISIVSIILFFYYLPTALSKVELENNRPILEPKLIIFEKNNEGFKFKFKVTNLGNIIARNIQALTISNVFAKAEFIPKQRELAHNAEIEINPSIVYVSMPNSTHANFNVILQYSASVNNIENNYISSFAFNVLLDELNNGEFGYEYSKHKEGKIPSDEQMDKLEIDERLNSNEGTYVFRFDEDKQRKDGKDGVAIFVNQPDKLVTFDTKSRTITFTYTFNNKDAYGEAHMISYKISGTDRKHFVALTWSSDKITLFVDGEGKESIFKKSKSE